MTVMLPVVVPDELDLTYRILTPAPYLNIELASNLSSRKESKYVRFKTLNYSFKRRNIKLILN